MACGGITCRRSLAPCHNLLPSACPCQPTMVNPRGCDLCIYRRSPNLGEVLFKHVRTGACLSMPRSRNHLSKIGERTPSERPQTVAPSLSHVRNKPSVTNSSAYPEMLVRNETVLQMSGRNCGRPSSRQATRRHAPSRDCGHGHGQDHVSRGHGMKWQWYHSPMQPEG